MAASVDVSLANGGTATLAYTPQGHEEPGPLHPLVCAVEGVGFEAALLATPPPIAIPPPPTPNRALGGGAALPVGGYGGGRSQGGGAMEVTMDLARPSTATPPQPITRYHTPTPTTPHHCIDTGLRQGPCCVLCLVCVSGSR